ncbi:lipoate--protein ligase family protein [Allopusillimonas soli]|uniref:Lipoate--protein ligase family protein n=1 Tax=Allopusillimonas soli TaxID=659016 RepID=A0A853F4Y6_9BURK|nr:lipoate--protein ligase family protein [Allopusillimonas soli]NYT35555.1 lipoate--protein ligase family protein [Allopusillimonas soli]TEA75958.1 lipoate--protein ligase family protein [Allopusillimonas soli]
MPFTLIVPEGPQAPDYDLTLIAQAAAHGPVASVWTSPQGLVVPRTYRRFPGFGPTCQQFADQGWPIAVRLSGGGIVPQGPGILNASLAFRKEGKPLDHSDAIYRMLCIALADALSGFGITSHAAAVEGSFCDGRFNLAVGCGKALRKVAGTAQLWRRHPIAQGSGGAAEGGWQQIVLVHALVLATADVPSVTAQANRFEAGIGSDRRYDPSRAASLWTLCKPPAPPDAKHFLQKLTLALAHSLAKADTMLI